jgi:hypothetical protein
VTDLDGNARLAGRDDDPHPLVGRGREWLLDEDRNAALDRGKGKRDVGGRRRRDHDRVELCLRDHRERLGERLRAGLHPGGRQDRPDRIRDGSTPVISAVDGLWAVAMASGLLQAGRDGQPVDLTTLAERLAAG